MERIITSIKGPVLALADKYLQRSRKIQRLQRCVSSLKKYLFLFLFINNKKNITLILAWQTKSV